ncbi:prephenate dehydratase [Thermodesulfobacteriota bacterium]
MSKKETNDIDVQLKGCRDKIDKIDNKLLDLLNDRANVVLEVGRIKGERNEKFYVPSREKKIVERLTKNNKGPFPNDALKTLMREIMSASLSLEKPMKIAFFGPKATFTHLACIKHFGASADMIPKRNINDVFDEVERGKALLGVIPIENTTEGVVTHTLDMLTSSDLKIHAEIMLRVSHYLLNLSGDLKDVKKVYSHPQPIAQCKNWLMKNLPDIPIVDVDSTAHAAQLVSGDGESAAIASEFAARMYGLKVAEERIEDQINNVTRFLVISRDFTEKTGNDKTSIMFSIRDKVGALYETLQCFRDRKVNMTKIESRPSKKKAWDYIFFVDVDGHCDDPNIDESLKELKNNTVDMKILGSYPKGILE